MKTIIVASTNPVKIDAARQAFMAMFPDEEFSFQGTNANSGVPGQPIGFEETKRGAFNRVAHAKTLYPNADFYMSNESGVVIDGEDVFVINWVVVANHLFSQASLGTSYPPPEHVKKLLREGYELDAAFREIYGAEAAKQGIGGVGKLTNNIVPRVDLISQATCTALIPFKNPELYGL